MLPVATTKGICLTIPLQEILGLFGEHKIGVFCVLHDTYNVVNPFGLDLRIKQVSHETHAYLSGFTPMVGLIKAVSMKNGSVKGPFLAMQGRKSFCLLPCPTGFLCLASLPRTAGYGVP
jgi:hypothetical protein